MALLRRMTAIAGALLTVLSATGCGVALSSISSNMAENLSAAILNQDDPQLVREGLPSYLLLLDSLVEADPDNPAALNAAAQLYAAYGAALVPDQRRARRLTARARDYGRRALCAADDSACELQGLPHSNFVMIVEELDEDSTEALYSYAVSTLAWIRTNSDDFKALAALPRVEVALNQVMQKEPGDLAPSACMYLGILNTLRPESLGGKPELGRAWFERGIELSGGKDLSIKVEFARSYARLVYDRELHDRLLNEVLAAEVKQENLTLFNQMARVQASELLSSANTYF